MPDPKPQHSPDVARDHRWMRAAYGIWTALWVLFAALTFIDPHPKLVYKIFANASRHWWTDISIYSSFESLDAYRYSPTFAVLFSPFALFPDRLGVVLWNIPSLVILFISLRILVRDLLPGDWPRWREGLFLFLTVFGTIRGVWTGQTNALITACAILAVVAVARQRWWLAAFLLAGPVFIKVWPVALFMLLAVFWRRQLIGRFVVACVPLAVLPFLTRAPAVVASEYGAFFASLTWGQSRRWPGNRDAWTIWEQFDTVQPTIYMTLQLVTAGAVLGWCLWQSRRGLPKGHFLMLILSIWSSWQLLFGPGTERLTYGLVAPFATWALLRSSRQGRLRTLALAAWLFTGVLGSGEFERLVQPVVPWSPALAPLGVVLFLGWLLLEESRRLSKPDVTIRAA